MNLTPNLNRLELHGMILPVDYTMGPGVLIEKLKNDRFDGCISMGQAAGISNIHLEKVAINLGDDPAG